jgi:DNA-binding CsgD family transcriptional regulator/PAS domain-containing protein
VLDRFSATINKIYGAAADGSRWPEALNSIEELTGSVGAVIGFVPKRPGELGFNLAGRFPAERCAVFTEIYQPICRRTRYMIEHPEKQVIYDALMITEQEMKSDPVYDWFGQHGLKYFVGGALPETSSYHTVCSFQRSPTQGHVQQADIEIFTLIKTHLGRAVRLADELGTLRTLTGFQTALLEALPQAVFALDAAGRILFANSAGAELLRCGHGFSQSEGMLLVTDPAEQEGLLRLIKEASTIGVRATSGWGHVSRCSGPPFAVFVAPLINSEEEQIAVQARVLVIVHDTVALRCASVEMLSGVYGLTETEARLASSLSGGHSVESASSLLNMQIGTARSHLKSVFRKLGVNRQQDLVRLLTQLSTISL